MIGKTPSHYRVDEQLGRGGMSEVYMTAGRRCRSEALFGGRSSAGIGSTQCHRDNELAGFIKKMILVQVATSTPKAGGPSTQDKSKWIAALERQPDGSWKVFWEMYNSDLPCQ